jgi:hypothetical protein
MLKYMLTTKCTRTCEYCITRNVVAEEELDLDKVESKLFDLYKAGHKDIMITGGEPSCAEKFKDKVYLCGRIFPNMYITTQNPKVLPMQLPYIKAVTFSLHDLDNIPRLGINQTVYGAILDKQYFKELPGILKDLRFSGLTINENQRGTEEFTEELENIKDFSIRVNKRGKCMNETILLPDLRVITDFSKYL